MPPYKSFKIQFPFNFYDNCEHCSEHKIWLKNNNIQWNLRYPAGYFLYLSFSVGYKREI